MAVAPVDPGRRDLSLDQRVVALAVISILLALGGALTVLVRTSGSSTSFDASALSQLAAPEATTTTAPPPFVAQDAHFSAVFPVSPQRQQVPLQAEGLSLQMTLFQAATNDEVVGVGFAAMPVRPSGATLQRALDNGVDNSARNLKGTVVQRQNTNFVGQQAEDALVQAPEETIHERVTFLGQGLYVFLGIVSDQSHPTPNYDTLLATFRTL